MYLYIRHSDKASHGSICRCSRLGWEHGHRGMKSHSLDLVCTTMTCLSAPLSAQSGCSPVYPYLDLSKVKQIQTLGNWNFVRNGNELRLEWNAWLSRSRKECRVGGSSRWNVWRSWTADQGQRVRSRCRRIRHDPDDLLHWEVPTSTQSCRSTLCAAITTPSSSDVTNKMNISNARKPFVTQMV